MHTYVNVCVCVYINVFIYAYIYIYIYILQQYMVVTISPSGFIAVQIRYKLESAQCLWLSYYIIYAPNNIKH